MQMYDTNPRPRGPSSAAIAEHFLAFFAARGHLVLGDMPLVRPDLDTSFVIAGMQPLMPYLLGRQRPPAPRLADLQRCLRTDDVEAVGTNGRKNSAFQMLGSWSVGDYGREEATRFALELLDELGLDRSRLWATTFAGDAARGLPPDEMIGALWRAAGIPAERIVPLGMEDNFWSTGGPGPCGPDTELFIDQGPALGCGQPSCRPGCACERFLEIWNLVFIEHELLPDGTYAPLPLRSVDTGMGLERMATVLQGVTSAFETDLFAPAMRRLDELTPGGGRDVDGSGQRARRMIVDHARAALFAWLADVGPDRDGRGSVVRRMIRRAARQGRGLGIEGPFLGELVEPLAAGHGALLSPAERDRLPGLVAVLTDEERRFSRTLTAGLRYLDGLAPDERGHIPGERLYQLHAERGFPSDLAAEILAERGLTVEWPGFERAREAHRDISRGRG